MLDRCVDNFFAETEQVAFGTLNIVPGIDFTNDPLLQGRNFSYLDTQLKRLGSPNFTHIPINAPKCPFHHFQQDGHMAMVNPKGRVNYEPNSWNNGAGGPRESPEKGFHSVPRHGGGRQTAHPLRDLRRPLQPGSAVYISQTDTEQSHIVAALTFELSKVERPDIRARMVAHLLNIDQDLAQQVADGLRLKEMPKAADAAQSTRQDLQKSPALSILLNGPTSFAGRKVGALVTDGVDINLLTARKRPWKRKEPCSRSSRRTLAVSRPATARGSRRRRSSDGAPSVLYDAVVLLPSEDGAKVLTKEPAARDFVADAFAHMKFIGYGGSPAAFEKAGVLDSRDDGCMHWKDQKDARHSLPRAVSCASGPARRPLRV